MIVCSSFDNDSYRAENLIKVTLHYPKKKSFWTFQEWIERKEISDRLHDSQVSLHFNLNLQHIPNYYKTSAAHSFLGRNGATS